MNHYYPQADDPTIERTWKIMQQHRGYKNRIDRDLLTLAVFGKVTRSYDRKIRDALAEIPVVWDDGYFIPETAIEAEAYIAGMHSRMASINKRLRILDDYLTRQQEPIKVQQMQLLEVF